MIGKQLYYALCYGVYYYIMCIMTQIVVPITLKFVFVLTKFGKPGKHLGVPTRITKFGQHKHKFFTVINNSALYKKMF